MSFYPPSLKLFQHRARKQRGAAAVELAIMLPLIMMMLAGITEFSRAFWYYNALDKATRDAARYMSSVHTVELATSAASTTQMTRAKNIVVDAVTGSESAKVTPALTTANVTVECDTANCVAPTWITVRINGFTIGLGSLIPFVMVDGGSFGNVPLTPSTTMPFMNY
jgi:Flp pilus assembly protein TadG